MHPGEIVTPDLGILFHHGWRHVHSVFATGGFEKMCGRFVSEPARPEMHADPDAVLLIREKIDVMIAAADRTELVARYLFQLANRFDGPGRVIKQRMIHPRFAFAADTE